MNAWPLLALGLGAGITGVLGLLVLARRAAWPAVLLRPNYSGRHVPVLLGALLVVGALAAFWSALGASGEAYRLHRWDLAAALSLLALFGAGALDDLRREGPRGLRGHVASLARGRPTTGILKLAVGVGAAAAIAALVGGSALRVAAGTVLMAVSVNVWNALDVVPGRSLKWGLIAIGALLAAVWGRTYGLLGAATLGAGLAVLPLDLRERGMLGDGGSNPLGLVVGMGLFLALPTAGVLVAALAGLGLQVAAETVTISRLIRAAPPLAWLDRLGRG